MATDFTPFHLNSKFSRFQVFILISLLLNTSLLIGFVLIRFPYGGEFVELLTGNEEQDSLVSFNQIRNN